VTNASSLKSANELQIVATHPPRKIEGNTNEGHPNNNNNANISMKERMQPYSSSFQYRVNNAPEPNYGTSSLVQSDTHGYSHSHSHHGHLYHPYYHPSHGIGIHHPNRNKDESETILPNPTPAITGTTTSSTTTSHHGARITDILKGESISEISSDYNRSNSQEVVAISPLITDRSENSDSDGGVESPNNENAVTTTSGSNLNMIPSSKSTNGQTYVDITEYLNCAQSDAAKKLGIPTSTLSKRWKEAVRGRKWPFRTVAKLDKEIMTLLHNIPQGQGAPPLPEDVEQLLSQLLRRRQEELKPVVIRI